jgi:hypothetical protein
MKSFCKRSYREYYSIPAEAFDPYSIPIKFIEPSWVFVNKQNGTLNLFTDWVETWMNDESAQHEIANQYEKKKLTDFFNFKMPNAVLGPNQCPRSLVFLLSSKRFSPMRPKASSCKIGILEENKHPIAMQAANTYNVTLIKPNFFVVPVPASVAKVEKE